MGGRVGHSGREGERGIREGKSEVVNGGGEGKDDFPSSFRLPFLLSRLRKNGESQAAILVRLASCYSGWYSPQCLVIEVSSSQEITP